jgi:hypothetical protein
VSSRSDEHIPAVPLPLYFSYSKSAGGRIWLFCESRSKHLKKDSASGQQEKDVEIYSKQDATASADKWGNALELPYCRMKYDEAVDT